MGLRTKINLVLIGVFALGLMAATAVFYQTAREAAQSQIRAQIEMLRAQALAVRAYTGHEVRPLLVEFNDIQFLRQTVPSWSAQAVFRNFQDHFPDFFYKEAVLNPTNPADLAEPWEAVLIEQLRADRGLEEVVVIRGDGDAAQFTVAFPLVVGSEACLECHSTPDAAPASLLATYGPEGGFGWRLDEVVGAQIFSVPLRLANEQVWTSVQWLVVSTSAIFLIVLALLNILLTRMVIAPVSRMATIAEEVSLGDSSQPEYVREGSDEIASLSRSFNRMRRSLDNAMKMLED